MKLLSLLAHDTVALITILNPIAAASIMISMLHKPTRATIGPIARKATLTVLVASLVTLFGGEWIFHLFGINVHSIKVIGGVILMMIAIHMVYGEPAKNRHSPEENKEAQEKEDISVVPIGIPILYGPGVIATIVVLQHSNKAALQNPLLAYALVAAAIVLSCIVVYFTLKNALYIHRLLGVSGMKILTRIMGLVVGAIAAQFLVGGVKALWIGS